MLDRERLLDRARGPGCLNPWLCEAHAGSVTTAFRLAGVSLPRAGTLASVVLPKGRQREPSRRRLPWGLLQAKRHERDPRRPTPAFPHFY